MNKNAFRSVAATSGAYVLGKVVDKFINDSTQNTELKKCEIELKKEELKRDIAFKELDIKKEIAFKNKD